MFIELMIRRRVARRVEGEERRKGGGVVRCYACAGDHHIRDCRKREHIAPRAACRHCGEMHWTVDCPARNERSIRFRVQ